jgi:hypothetical protein
MSNDLPVFKFSFIKYCPENDSSIERRANTLGRPRKLPSNHRLDFLLNPGRVYSSTYLFSSVCEYVFAYSYLFLSFQTSSKCYKLEQTDSLWMPY